MFERAIHRIIEEGLETLVKYPAILDKFMRGPAWEDAEVEKLKTFFLGKGRPSIVHNYAKILGVLPCYAIVLAAEKESDEYLGRSEGAETIDELSILMTEISQVVGHQVSANIRRMSVTYQVFTYAESPDVVAAYHNILRAIFLGADKKLHKYGMELPSYSGMDLMHMPERLPENVFARMFQIEGFVQHLTVTNVDINPWIQRFNSISGLHLQNAVIGVEGGITPMVFTGE